MTSPIPEIQAGANKEKKDSLKFKVKAASSKIVLSPQPHKEFFSSLRLTNEIQVEAR